MHRILLSATALALSTPALAQDGSAFNPDISLILQGRYAHQKDIEERGITGFAAGGHEHGRGRGFSLDASELVFSGNIDPYFRGYAALALADEEVEVEEAWFQTMGLGRGFTAKGGRFLSGIGYVNEQHPHAWDFADQNLMYRALFGEHLIQDGVQARWLAPTETFLELGVELARGQFFPGSEAGGDRNGAGAWAAFAKVGGDLGESHSWRAGINYLAARPREREGHFEDVNQVEAHTAFTGDSKAWIADFVWKWAPDGNPAQRNFKFQAEYFQREEAGELACEDNTADGGACAGLTDAYRSRQSGWYAQGVFQFMPRWRAGYRYDRLDSGTASFGAIPIAHQDYKPYRHSVMLDFSPSEFSRLRLQLAQDRSMQGVKDAQVILQYVHSLGAHGAHRF
jgi:outer membrane receptor protein involved in Fe transport